MKAIFLGLVALGEHGDGMRIVRVRGLWDQVERLTFAESRNGHLSEVVRDAGDLDLVGVVVLEAWRLLLLPPEDHLSPPDFAPTKRRTGVPFRPALVLASYRVTGARLTFQQDLSPLPATDVEWGDPSSTPEETCLRIVFSA